MSPRHPASTAAFVIEPLTYTARKSPEILMCCVEHAAEALERVDGMVGAGATPPSCEVLNANVMVALALAQQMSDGCHERLPKPVVGPSESMSVDPLESGAAEKACKLAHASAMRPLMSVEAMGVLANLGQKGQGAMEAAIARFANAAQRLVQVMGFLR